MIAGRAKQALLRRFSSVRGEHRAIARGMFWTVSFVLIGKVAGALKEMLVAYRYGISNEVDSYLFVLNIVNWPIALWFSVLTIVLIPLLGRLSKHPKDATLFRSEVNGVSLCVGLVTAALICGAFWASSHPLLHALQLGPRGIGMHGVVVLALTVPLGAMVSVFSAYLLSQGRHWNTLLEAVPATTVALAVGLSNTASSYPLVLGTFAGLVLQVLLLRLALPAQSRSDGLAFTTESPSWSAFRRGFGIMLIGQALMSLTSVIDQFFAAQLTTGAIATLSYGNRVLSLIMAMGALAVTRGTLPVFSVRGSGDHVDIARKWAILLLIIGMIAAIGVAIGAPLIVRVLFEHGAFSRKDTEAVTAVVRAGVAQAPFYFGGLVLVSVLASQGRHRVIAFGAAINFVAKVAANAMLIPTLGIVGINLATVVMYIVSFIWLWTFTFRRPR